MAAASTSSVRVSGHEQREDGKVVYVVVFDMDGGLESDTGVQVYTVRKRYSEFDVLRATLERLHGAEISALPFPGKETLTLRKSNVVKMRERTLDEFIKAAVRLVPPSVQRADSAAAVLHQFLVPSPQQSQSAVAPAEKPLSTSVARPALTVIFLENQRCGGLSEAFRNRVPSEDQYSKDLLLMAVDPPPWSSLWGSPRPAPEALRDASQSLLRSAIGSQCPGQSSSTDSETHLASVVPAENQTPGKCPLPGWRWSEDTEWQIGPWEYRSNFFSHAGGGTEGWETEMCTKFGNKSWVRRRRWARVVERDPDIAWCGWLEKRKLAGSDFRWFALTEHALYYYQQMCAKDSRECLAALVESPPAAANSGAIPLSQIKEVVPGAAGTSVAEDTFVLLMESGRTIILRAPDSAGVDLWTIKIEEAAGRTLIRPEAVGADTAAAATRSTIIRCAAVEARTGADEWLAPQWMQGAAAVLTAHNVHVFDSSEQMVVSLNLRDLQQHPNDPRSVAVEEAQSMDKGHELRLHTIMRQYCLRLAFETRNEREAWADEILKAIDQLPAAYAAAQPPCAAALLPSDEDGMPADKCVVHVHISGRHTMARLSQYFCVKPDYFALFDSLKLLQDHMEAPCHNRPTIYYPLRGMHVRNCAEDADGEGAAVELKTATDDRTLTLTGAVGVAQHIGNAIRNELQKQEDHGLPSCRDAHITSSCFDQFVQAVGKVQANSNYTKHQQKLQQEAEQAEAERVRMADEKDMSRRETFTEYAIKVVRRDWAAREVKTAGSAGTGYGTGAWQSRLVTPALESMFSIYKILLQSDASAEKQGEDITAVAAAFSNELSSALRTIEFDPSGDREENRTVRLYLLAWIHNCLLLDSYLEELLYSGGIDTADTSTLYDAARACQTGVARLYNDEIDHLLAQSNQATAGNGGLFTSTQKADSPTRETMEYFYSVCTTELQIQECNGSSAAETRMRRQIADEMLQRFADHNYFPTLLKRVKPRSLTDRVSSFGAATTRGASFGTATTRLVADEFELRDFRHVLEDDLDLLERVYTQFYVLLSEAVEDTLINAEDDSCIKTVDLPAESPCEFGLKLNQSCTNSDTQSDLQEESLTYRARRDETLPFPLIVEDVVKGSGGYDAGLRRGMVLVASCSDSLKGAQRFIDLELVHPLTATILTLGEICEQLSAVRALGDAMGDDTKSLQAYVRLCHYDTPLAFSLVSAVSNWEDTTLSKLVAEVDTSRILRRQLSSSTRSHRTFQKLRSKDAHFQVSWWNTPRGAPDDLPVGSQFLSLKNSSSSSLSVGTEWQDSSCSWWQNPPAVVDGNGQLFTWAASTKSGSSSHFGDTKGAIVFTGCTKSGHDFAVALGWDTPCLSFAPLVRKKLLRQGYRPRGNYPRKPTALVTHPQNLERPEQLQAHFERTVGSRQSKGMCQCLGIQVVCEVLTKVDRAALVGMLEYMSSRKLLNTGVEHGVWATLEAARAGTVGATRQDIMQEIVRALCGDDESDRCAGSTDSMFMKREIAVTDKDVHQCIFTVRDMTGPEVEWRTCLDQLIQEMREHPTLVADTRRYLLTEYDNCFVGTELVDWLVSAVQRSASGQKLLQAAEGETISLQQLVPEKCTALNSGDQVLYESQLVILRHVLQAVQENRAVAAAPAATVVNASATQIARLRSGIVAIGCSLVELGMVRHVVDEHDFEDGGLFYRVTYIPTGHGRMVRNGTLEKEPGTGLIKAFEKRWFELEEGTGKLHYYRQEYGRKAGTIPSADSGHEILSVKAPAGSREITIQCGPPAQEFGTQEPGMSGGWEGDRGGAGEGRTYLLRAQTAVDAQDWADAILRERDSSGGKSRTAAHDRPQSLAPLKSEPALSTARSKQEAELSLPTARVAVATSADAEQLVPVDAQDSTKGLDAAANLSVESVGEPEEAEPPAGVDMPAPGKTLSKRANAAGAGTGPAPGKTLSKRANAAGAGTGGCLCCGSRPDRV